MFDNPEDLVLKFQEKHNYVCYLKTIHKIDVPSKYCYDISTQDIKHIISLMSNIVSTTTSSALDIKECYACAMTSRMMKDLSTENTINLEYFVIVNSKRFFKWYLLF